MDFNKAAIWMKMHDLPLSCMEADIGVEIGKTIGEVKECAVFEEDLGGGRCLESLLKSTSQNRYQESEALTWRET